MSDLIHTNFMMNEIRELLLNARQRVTVQVNTELLSTYWNVGKIIVEYEQKNKDRADYGKQTLKQLSKELTAEFGKGFSRSNLQNMRAFYLAYPICQTVSGKLSWSHYCELLTISDPDKRSFYEKETINSGWSIRELKRQISTSLYGKRFVLTAAGEYYVGRCKEIETIQKEITIQMERFSSMKIGRASCRERVFVPV